MRFDGVLDTHNQANLAILKHLLLDGDGVMTVEHDPAAKTRSCPRRPLQDHSPREALAWPIAVSHPRLAVHRRRRLLPPVLRATQRRRR